MDGKLHCDLGVARVELLLRECAAPRITETPNVLGATSRDSPRMAVDGRRRAASELLTRVHWFGFQRSGVL